MNILQVNTSARVEGALSTRLADSIVARLRVAHPNAYLTLRDLSRYPHPMLDSAALQALMIPEAQRTPAQAARVALDDKLIAQVQATNILVIGVPMYNFGITTQMKAWIDAITRAKVTFQYTPDGPEGQLKDKTVYVALARGGAYRNTPFDSQVLYLKTILKFLGMENIHFIYAEGLMMGEEAVSKAFALAEKEIEALISL